MLKCSRRISYRQGALTIRSSYKESWYAKTFPYEEGAFKWYSKNFSKPRIHKRAEWFVHHLQTVCEPNACMCGRDCEPVLRHPRTVRILFAANQNLSLFCANTKRTGCASMHQVSFTRLRFVEN